MKVIWKYPLRLSGGEPVLIRTMPWDAVPVRLAMQNDVPMLWCFCNPKSNMADRRFVVAATGREVPDTARYIGSCADDPYVWHAFELL